MEKLRLNDNKLLKALGQADSAVSSENPERAYSYFTEDCIGVSFSVSHAVGDHVEFELPTTYFTFRPEKVYLLQ